MLRAGRNGSAHGLTRDALADNLPADWLRGGRNGSPTVSPAMPMPAICRPFRRAASQPTGQNLRSRLRLLGRSRRDQFRAQNILM
jgi:hypothetical protein